MATNPVVSIAKTAVVCQETTFIGPFDIIIGDETVIHPKAQIKAIKGPITIGQRNIIEEFAVIQNE
jgi:carbonic anhydrase/acetyltransferase-like protein (isoleucine patch superfamily)